MKAELSRKIMVDRAKVDGVEGGERGVGGMGRGGSAIEVQRT